MFILRHCPSVRILVFAAVLLDVFARNLWSAQPGDPAVPDKSGYNLFNPTPRELMRELSADRPDQTESPNTVNAGHFQLEMDFARAEIDHDDADGRDIRSKTFVVAPMNLKIGVLNNLDVHLMLDPYVHSRVDDRNADSVERASGFGGLASRVKLTLWGNDGGPTTLAFMPFVKWPLPESSVRNGKTEGGAILIFGIELPHGWSATTMAEIDILHNGHSGYNPYFTTITVARQIAGDLAGYVEFAALVAPESGDDWQGQVDLGFTYGIGDNTQLDLGCNFGVTRSAPDFVPFIGITWRY